MNPNGDQVGSAGDQTGGFRIAGENLLFTPTNATSFTPGSWVPLGSPAQGAQGNENDFGVGQSDPHAGAFRNAPSIFVQHSALHIRFLNYLSPTQTFSNYLGPTPSFLKILWATPTAAGPHVDRRSEIRRSSITSRSETS